MSEFIANIKARLNTSEIPNDIKKIENQQVTIKNVTIDAKAIADAIQKELNNAKFSLNINSITSQMRQQGTESGKQFVKALTSELNTIQIRNNGIDEFANFLSKDLKYSQQSVNAITKDLKELNLVTGSIQTRIKDNGVVDFKIKGTDDLGRTVDVIKRFGKEVDSTVTTVQKFGRSAAELKQIEKLEFGIKTGDFETKFNTLIKKSRELSTVSQLTKDNISKLSTAFSTMNNANADIDTRIKAYREFQSLLPVVNRSLNQTASQEKEALRAIEEKAKSSAQAAKDVATANQTLTRSETLSNKIEAWMNANTEAAKRYGTQLQAIQQQLKNNQDPEVLKRMTLEFSKIQSEAKAAGLVVNNFASSLKNTVLQVLGLTSAVAIFHRGVRVLKEMVQNVKDVDKAMTELYRVTNLSSSQYEALYDKMANSAKKYGATLSDIINSTASWVRLGFSADVASSLSEISAMYQHVTDLDETTAVKNLVTAYKGFQDSLLAQTGGNEVEAFVKISDIYDKLGMVLPMTNYIG